jgi:Arc/MetJ family transcription regulator
MSHRTTIELDEALLNQVRGILDTSGIRETVEAAMRAVVRAHLRQQLVEQIRSQDGADIGPDVLAATRPTR